MKTSRTHMPLPFPQAHSNVFNVQPRARRPDGGRHGRACGARTGRYLLIDIFLIIFYSAVLSSCFFGPLGIVEIYLYRRKKGVWYEWKIGRKTARRDRSDRADLEARTYWKSEAFGYACLKEPASNADRRATARDCLKPRTTHRSGVAAGTAHDGRGQVRAVGKAEAAERCYRRSSNDSRTRLRPRSGPAAVGDRRTSSNAPGSLTSAAASLAR